MIEIITLVQKTNYSVRVRMPIKIFEADARGRGEVK